MNHFTELIIILKIEGSTASAVKVCYILKSIKFGVTSVKKKTQEFHEHEFHVCEILPKNKHIHLPNLFNEQISINFATSICRKTHYDIELLVLKFKRNY